MTTWTIGEASLKLLDAKIIHYGSCLAEAGSTRR